MQVIFLILSFMRLQRIDDRYFLASLQEWFNAEVRDGTIKGLIVNERCGTYFHMVGM